MHNHGKEKCNQYTHTHTHIESPIISCLKSNCLFTGFSVSGLINTHHLNHYSQRILRSKSDKLKLRNKCRLFTSLPPFLSFLFFFMQDPASPPFFVPSLSICWPQWLSHCFWTHQAWAFSLVISLLGILFLQAFTTYVPISTQMSSLFRISPCHLSKIVFLSLFSPIVCFVFIISTIYLFICLYRSIYLSSIILFL